LNEESPGKLETGKKVRDNWVGEIPCKWGKRHCRMAVLKNIKKNKGGW